ncbi:MAG: efflux RND transporter permease subunit [Candidatus Berkiella sp.]
MKLSQFCINRPIFSIVINLMIVLTGIIAFQKLTVREYPDITTPVINVSTSYPGASAEIVESEITRVIEDALSGITGLDFLQSSSNDGSSNVTMVFKPNQDIELSANDVRDNISRVKGELPRDAKDPIVSKVEADSHAIVWISLSSEQFSLMQMSEIAEQTIKDKLEILPGVARVQMVGDRLPAMRVWIDPARLAAYQMTVQDVIHAISRQNIALPSGSIEGETTEFTIYSKTDLQTEHEFRNIILRDSNGYLVKLVDVADVRIDAKSTRFIARFNGKPSVALGLVKQSTANPLDIANELYRVFPSIKNSLPKGIELQIAYDSTKVIKESIQAVRKTILEAVLLVVFIIFIFLRSMRATLIPIITIPISLLGGMMMIYVFGFSINLLTLLAMVLAIGLVVDDAIVVLENIYRHIEEGESPIAAARKGMNEIGSAVIAMTLTLAAVFAPIAFMEGKFGKLFTEFAVVLAGCVFISGFTALTLSPVMCSKLLKKESSHGKFYYIIENSINKISQKYRQSLAFCLKKRYWIVAALALVLVANGILFSSLKSEMTPMEDRGFAMLMGMAKEGATIEFTTKHALKFEPIIDSIEDIKDYFLIVGYPNVRQAIAFTILKDRNMRKASQFQVVDELNQKLYMIPGLMSFALNPPSSLSDDFFDTGVSIMIQYPGNYQKLKTTVEKVMAKARMNPKLSNLDTDLKANKPQIELVVNREKAALSGVSVDEIGQTLQILMGGRDVTHFQKGAKQYDVVVKSFKAFRHQLEDIYDVKVRTKNGMVPLINFIEAKEVTVASSLNRFNKLPSAKISASLAPDYTVDEAIEYFRGVIEEIDGLAQIDYTGTTRMYMNSSGSIYYTFLLALLVVFLVLAAQFESFIKPFVIMLSVPLATFGSLITMHLHGGSLNIYSQIGFITLVGLITKHGILIVEFTKQLRDEAVPLEEAILKASFLRFRPILMTTMATICGCIPLALAMGAGSESRQEIGWVVVGGMALGTVFTLYVVPVMLRILSGREENVAVSSESLSTVQ